MHTGTSPCNDVGGRQRQHSQSIMDMDSLPLGSHFTNTGLADSAFRQAQEEYIFENGTARAEPMGAQA